MHRFFVDEGGLQAAEAWLEPGDARHAWRVLRLEPGAQVELMDGERRCLGEILQVGEEGCRCRVLSQLPTTEAGLRLTLFQGLPKAEKMELIAQKLTELGAVEIVPVAMQRCVVRLDGRDGEKKRERWQKIVREAAKQSGRTVTPAVAAPVSFAHMLERLTDYDAALVPWEDARGYGLRRFAAEHPQAKKIALVVGPEGGMTPEEIARMEQHGARQITLGSRILRTETAGLAAVSALLALYGDMDA